MKTFVLDFSVFVHFLNPFFFLGFVFIYIIIIISTSIILFVVLAGALCIFLALRNVVLGCLFFCRVRVARWLRIEQ